MSTATPEQQEPIKASPDGGESLIRRCVRCDLAYAPSKSTSALRLTYCSFLCELGHLGFSIAGLEHMERNPEQPESEEAPEQPESEEAPEQPPAEATAE
ncbi:MAG TPA: hypothetical protein QGF35_06530 [Dehalococcoidia bacterium]|nr:hypothetical protein [Dehalococcoidia bacterium]